MPDQEKTQSVLFEFPSADPQIQLDYEAALGAFLVAFNEIEHAVDYIIFLALQKSKREDILKHLSADSFRRKLVALDLISLAYSKELPKKLVDELRDLATCRNRLAHGHFHQNPFDGSYEIVTTRHHLDMPIRQVERLTKRAQKASDTLRHAQLQYELDDPTNDESLKAL